MTAEPPPSRELASFRPDVSDVYGGSPPPFSSRVRFDTHPCPASWRMENNQGPLGIRRCYFAGPRRPRKMASGSRPTNANQPVPREIAIFVRLCKRRGQRCAVAHEEALFFFSVLKLCWIPCNGVNTLVISNYSRGRIWNRMIYNDLQWFRTLKIWWMSNGLRIRCRMI